MSTPLDPNAVLAKLYDIGLASGLFVNTLRYEPRGTPANGLTLSLISGPKTPIKSSGLNSVSLRWQIDGQIYLPMHMDPPENLDVLLTKASAGYLERLCAQFTLGGLVRCVDVFGSDGAQLEATPGYLEMGDKKYRVERLMIPLLINDRWVLTP